MTDRDRQLDDVLRRVPLPGDLSASVRPERLFDDSAIDRLVGRVAVPPGLAERVRRCVERGTPFTGVVDLSRFAAGRPGEPPAAAETPAAAAAHTQTALVAAGKLPVGSWRWGLNRVLTVAREAGTVAAALALTLLVAAVGIEVSRQLEGPPAARGTRLAQRSTAGTPEAEPRRQPEQRPQPTERSLAEAAPAELAQAADDPALEALAIAPAGVRNLRNAPETDGRSSPAGRDRERAESITVVRGAPLVAPSWQTTPTMSLVALPQAARRRIPRSPGFDFAFEMAHGEAPFVDPDLDADLLVDRPPLTVATDGFDALLQNGLGRRPRRQPIRVEEILAAMPPPPTLVNEAIGPVRLGLHVAPSGRRIGGMPTLLLEAAVYAAGEAAPAAEASRLTLVIDQSVAGDARVWPRICRGLAAVAGRLEQAARVTVVLCGPRPRIAIRDAEPAELIAASTAWERLPPAASADLDAGLRLAATEAASGRTIVAAHAVTLDQGRANTVEALGEWHRALAVAGGDTVACTPEVNAPRFVIIDPAAPGPSGGVEPTFGRTGSDAASIRRELLRQVTIRPSLVARHCQLEIRFDPAHVARYRIIGHRQSTIESLAVEGHSGVDLHAGETVRAVYEVIPRKVGDASLAKAILTWRSVEGGPRRLEVSDHGREKRRPGQSLSAHERSLLLATWLGELAAGSAYKGDGGSLLTLLAAVADEWRSEGGLTPFGKAVVDIVDRRPREPRPRP